MIGAQQMHLRTPVAQCPLALPRSCRASHRQPASVQPQAAFTHSTAQLRPQAAGRRAQRRAQRLQVLAAATKKSVGDLSKADLEGKVVFVRSPGATVLDVWCRRVLVARGPSQPAQESS